jgi:general secretion pathway protein D
VPLPGLSSFGSGKEDHPSLIKPMSSFDLEPVFEGENKTKAVEKKSMPASMTPKKTEPANPGIMSTSPVSLPVVPAQKTPAVQQVPADLSSSLIPVTAPAQRSLLQISAPSSVTIGQQFNLEIKINDVKDLANSPFVLTYDPVFVDFVSISEGQLLKKDGKSTTFSSKTDAAAGTVSVSLSRAAGSGGISGGGTIASASFRAKNQGPANFAFKNPAFTSSYGASLNVLPFSTAVDIR